MLTDTEKIILKRRSIRKFNRQPIEDDKIERVLKAAMAAPSARKHDPWRFIILKKSLQKASLCCANGIVLRAAGNGILIYGDLNATYDNEPGFLLQDCSAAIQNMLIAATAMNVASCWMGIYPREERIKKLQELFSLSENEIPIGIVALGYSDEWPEPETRFNENLVKTI